MSSSLDTAQPDYVGVTSIIGLDGTGASDISTNILISAFLSHCDGKDLPGSNY